jgi:hypothetical protein
LPSVTGPPAQHQLLWALFDLIRNGQAHRYQQIPVVLTDGRQFMIGHGGADLTLDCLRRRGRAESDHLAYKRGRDGNLYMLVRPDWLVFDLKDSISEVRPLSRGLTFQYLTRPRGPRIPRIRSRVTIPGPYYQFDSGALEAALRKGQHAILRVGPP